MELISNSLNFLNTNSKQELQIMFESIKGYLKCFKIRSLYSEGKSRVKLEILDEEKLTEVEKVAKVLINS